MEHERIKPHIKEIADLVRETGNDGRVDFRAIADKTGINIITSNQFFLPSCSIETFSEDQYRVICMPQRTQMPRKLYDFSIGHEFGHLLLGHLSERSSFSVDREEREANYFSHCLVGYKAPLLSALYYGIKSSPYLILQCIINRSLTVNAVQEKVKDELIKHEFEKNAVKWIKI